MFIVPGRADPTVPARDTVRTMAGTSDNPSSTRVRRAGWILTSAFALAVTAVAPGPGGQQTAAAASGFQALSAPQRLLDTRPGESTADGRFQGQGARTEPPCWNFGVGQEVVRATR